jgi:DNA-binding NarL/FixJ family response regulator
MSPVSKMAGNIRVLIVEDQGMMAAFFARWLAELPRYTLAGSAKSGEDALGLLESAQPDVALVDFQLPWMDGLEFIRTARQVRPQLRCLVVTTLVDPLSLTRVRESGVEGYIEKDASPEMLAEALAAVADGRRIIRRPSGRRWRGRTRRRRAWRRFFPGASSRSLATCSAEKPIARSLS